MDEQFLPERLGRLANQLKALRGGVRGLEQDARRLRGDAELAAQYRRAVQAVLDLDQLVWRRLQERCPVHLRADLAPRELATIARVRRELLGELPISLRVPSDE
ncbi:MAG: hypothetical protein HY691_16670 [Chloroflexi bacterium]|nr:hypothetical protein [Chloroflexota bacterium]